MNDPINPGQPWEVYRARLESIKEKLEICEELQCEVVRDSRDSTLTDQKQWAAHDVLWKLTDVITRLEYMQ